MMTDEILLKFLALVVVALIGLANILKFDPLKEWKEDIKTDLDILSKLEKDDKLYKVIEASARISILAVYSKDHNPWYSWSYKRNRPIILFFSLFFVASLLILVL
jgi:hypothetical protein